MKIVILVGDGMADEPIPSLLGKTPLEAANTPTFDKIAREGRSGLLNSIPDGFEAGSDIANLSILGYDPSTCYTGRGPLEALSIGLDTGDKFVYRCNIVSIINDVMTDFTAGHITTKEATELLNSLNGSIDEVSFYPGVSYRNLLTLENGAGGETVPPHDIVGENIGINLPTGADSDILFRAFKVSERVFLNHEVNRVRISEGKIQATHIWPWGGGKRPSLENFKQKTGLSGGIISAVDLLNGIGRGASMKIIKVPGATGFLDTDYQAKARYALLALKELDFVFIHIEAPDEAGHMGSLDAKIKAIEEVDRVAETILKEFHGIIAILPDHPTPVSLKTHTRDPVPFAVLGLGTDSVDKYSERDAAKGSFGIINATSLLPILINSKGSLNK